MLTKNDLLNAIDELEDAPVTYQNCQKLATFYTLLHSLFEPPTVDYSYKAEETVQTVIGRHGDSEFLRLIEGRNADFVWDLVNETMDALKVLQPKLYDSVIRRLT